jgi:hypothetical protein
MKLSPGTDKHSAMIVEEGEEVQRQSSRTAVHRFSKQFEAKKLANCRNHIMGYWQTAKNPREFHETKRF